MQETVVSSDIDAAVARFEILTPSERVEFFAIVGRLSPFDERNRLLRLRDDKIRDLRRWYPPSSVRKLAGAISADVTEFQCGATWRACKHALITPDPIVGTRAGAFFAILKLGPMPGPNQLRLKILRG